MGTSFSRKSGAVRGRGVFCPYPPLVFIPQRGGEAVIRGGKAEFSLTTLTVEDFPEFAEVEDRSQAAADAAELSRALRQVVRAASTDEVRPVLTGVLWSFGDGAVRLVATDSYRPALREVTLKEGPSEGGMIVPGRAVVELGRALRGARGAE